MAASWTVMTAVAVALIGASVLVSDRLAARITRPARDLAAAAAALGEGDLTAGSTLAGPPELIATGHALNLMAKRLTRLISAERGMEREIDLIIRAARRPAPGEPSGCDAAEVMRERMGFWSALAEDQGRPCRLIGADRPVRVPVPRSELAAAADALIGNVFRHTAEGTEFAITVHPGRDLVLIFFADAA